jgi:hypothetical protein
MWFRTGKTALVTFVRITARRISMTVMKQDFFFTEHCLQDLWLKREIHVMVGKKAKERLTVLLCSSGSGEKVKPLVIGRSQNPCCFKGYHKSNLRVTYEANRKALDDR